MSELFALHVPVWELIARGSLVYWFLFVLFRFGLRRDSGSLGLADVLLVVLIADASQNGMSGEYKSVAEAMILVGTIAGWNVCIDWMAFQFPWFARFADPSVVMLIQHGRVIRRNLRREMLTVHELQSQLRQAGVMNIGEVKRATLEPDGHIGVIRYSGELSSRRKGVPGAAQ